MKEFLLVACLALAACGGGSADQASQDSEDRETVFDPLTDQLDRAKAVEDTVQQHKDDIDAALRDAEDDPP